MTSDLWLMVDGRASLVSDLGMHGRWSVLVGVRNFGGQLTTRGWSSAIIASTVHRKPFTVTVRRMPLTTNVLVPIKEPNGCESYLEGILEGQPGEHSDKGVPGDRVERHDLVQSAPWRVSDAHPAETMVPDM